MTALPWITNFLTSSGVPFEERHHPQVFSAAQVAEKEKLSPDEVAKVVIVLIQHKPIGLVLPASRKVALRTIEEIAQTHDVRLATEDEIRGLFPDCEVGTLPPLNHWNGIELWVDRGMETKSGEMLIQAGTHQDAIRLRYEDWFRLVKPRLERFAILVRFEEKEAGKSEGWAKAG